MKKKIFWKQALVLLVFTIIVMPSLSACSTKNSYGYSQKNVKIFSVRKKENVDFLNFSGNLEGNKETVIAAKVAGQVSAIKVNIGDSVKKHDLLATLSGEENYSERNTANESYHNSLANLKDTEYLMQQEIAKAKASLGSAEENLRTIQMADKNEDAVSEKQIEQVKLDLEKAKIAKIAIDNSFEQKEKDIAENMNSAISQALLVSKNALAYLYLINNENFSQELDDFEFNNNFVADPDDRKQTVMLIKKAKAKYFNVESVFKEQDKENVSTNILIPQSDDTIEMLNSVKEALQSMNAIVLSAVSHVKMTKAQLANCKMNLSTYISQIENILLSQSAGVATGLLGTRQAFSTLNIEKNNQLKQINKDIAKANKQLKMVNAKVVALKDDLAGKTALAKTQLDLAKNSLGTAKAQQKTQIQIAKSQFDLARGGLNMANVNVANTRLRAPYNGVVMERLIDEGAIVGAGTPILKIADISSYKLVIFVPESQIGYIKVGQTASATIDSIPEKIFSATVLRISPKSETSSKKIRVELGIKNDKHLKIGMYMNLRIQLETNDLSSKEVLIIPYEALISENNKYYVWVLEDGKAHRKEIKIGQVDGDKLELLSGLNIGEKVIYKGLDSLMEGEEVVIKK